MTGAERPQQGVHRLLECVERAAPDNCRFMRLSQTPNVELRTHELGVDECDNLVEHVAALCFGEEGHGLALLHSVARTGDEITVAVSPYARTPLQSCGVAAGPKSSISLSFASRRPSPMSLPAAS